MLGICGVADPMLLSMQEAITSQRLLTFLEEDRIDASVGQVRPSTIGILFEFAWDLKGHRNADYVVGVPACR